jgi:hypothetical protein
VKEVMDTSIEAEKAKNWEDEVEITERGVLKGDRKTDKTKCKII